MGEVEDVGQSSPFMDYILELIRRGAKWAIAMAPGTRATGQLSDKQTWGTPAKGSREKRFAQHRNYGTGARRDLRGAYVIGPDKGYRPRSGDCNLTVTTHGGTRPSFGVVNENVVPLSSRGF